MKNNTIRFLILTLIGIFVYSCQNDIEETTQIEKSLNEELASESNRQIILREKLENPYSVKNMRLALKSLKAKQKKSSKTLNDDLDIQLTLNAFENFDPRERPDNVAQASYRNRTGWTGWVPCGIMHDLIDTNVDQVRTGFDDNITGYSIENIFNALDKGIESPQAFRERLLSENDNRDEADVRDLFEAYFWN